MIQSLGLAARFRQHLGTECSPRIAFGWSDQGSQVCNEILTIISDEIPMNAIDTHALLLTCPAPVGALHAFSEDIANGVIQGTATVVYNRGGQFHEGPYAKLRPYWRRIEAAAQQSALWTGAAVVLPLSGKSEAVSLTKIVFDEIAVKKFVEDRRPQKPKRGRKRNQDDWTPFWIAAAKLGKVGMLNVGIFQTQADLVLRLHEMMGATLDEQTIKPFSAVIYKKVVMASLDDLEKDLAYSD